VAPQTPDSIAAQLLKNFRGQHIGLLAPLVVSRKGVYTELAEWARPRGFTHLRVDGNFLPTTGFPRIDRFKEHTHRAAGGQPGCGPCATKRRLRAGAGHGADPRQGRGARAQPPGRPAAAMLAGRQPTAGIGTMQDLLHQARLPVCATSYAELDPRLFSYNSKHGWCPDCVGTGVAR